LLGRRKAWRKSKLKNLKALRGNINSWFCNFLFSIKIVGFSTSNAPSEAEKAVNELTRIKEEIKLKNNNFIDVIHIEKFFNLNNLLIDLI